MRRHLGILLAATGAALGVAAADAQRELDAVVERLNAMDQWLQRAGADLADRQRTLDGTERRIADHARRVRELDGEAARLRTDQEEALAEGAQLAARHAELAGRIADHLRAAWRLTGQDALKQMLNQEKPADAQRHMRYHGYLAKARATDLEALRETRTALADHSTRLTAKRAALGRTQAELAEGRTALVAERRAQKALLVDLEAELSDKRRERTALANDRERLETLLRELARRAQADKARTADLGPGPDGLRWPVPGRVLHAFGDSRAGGRMRWQGVYLTAPRGTDIVAVGRGTVAFADWLRGFGMLCIIDHGGATMSLYGHADTLYKKLGDLVEGGEPIAAVGQSGGASDVGVYFEIRRGGKPIDPQKWLKSRP